MKKIIFLSILLTSTTIFPQIGFHWNHYGLGDLITVGLQGGTAQAINFGINQTGKKIPYVGNALTGE